jgi:hypothetical protein
MVVKYKVFGLELLYAHSETLELLGRTMGKDELGVGEIVMVVLLDL